MAYPKRYLDCKAWGHGRWDRYTPDPGEFKIPQIGRRFFQLCPDCGTIRYRSCNRITGAYLDSGWKYRTPDNYKPSKPMTRQDFRRAYFRNASAAPAKKNRRLRVA